MASILLPSPCDPFYDGHTTGYLEFYDERHRPPIPLSSQTVCDYLMRIWGNQSEPALWRAGRVAGWIEALAENAPGPFVSIPVSEKEPFLGSV